MVITEQALELKKLEKDRVALENTNNNPAIAAAMAKFGYTDVVMDEGRALYTKTRNTYDANTIEEEETTEAYNKFTNDFKALNDRYNQHRSLAKIVFKNDGVNFVKLALQGMKSKAYVYKMETIRTFYRVALSDTNIQTKLARFMITPESLQESLSLLELTETNRAEYLNEKGESQEATRLKDIALQELDHWMSDFYQVARIALADQPQLLEVLGIKVKR
ncbi:hypothetical protein [Saccharicrinis aurantiacus]|uniref:hypothetical protein n=1 Tax=Saccharicrinis aurantiacus TaxID=1849719 RepID=UPI00249029EA|nr:hypothetical protein [Saccharicrinis aurantiacus]